MARWVAILAQLLGLAEVARADEAAGIWYAEQDGQIIIDTLDPGTDSHTPFAIGSLGKMMTAVAVLQLVEEGALDLNAPITPLMPADVRGQAQDWQGIEVRHLLTMTSGLPEYYNRAFQRKALRSPETNQTPLAAITSIAGQERLFPPGQDFHYSNTNFVLLGMILEEVEGQPYSHVLMHRVLRPAGMDQAFVFGSQGLPADFPQGHAGWLGLHQGRSYYQGQGFGDGGVIASAGDVAAFFRALFIDQILLLPSSLAQMQTDPLGTNSDRGYGMGLVLRGNVVGHSGADLGFVADAGINVETGVIAVALHANARKNLTDWPWNPFEIFETSTEPPVLKQN